jgi:hypothetical protein
MVRTCCAGILYRVSDVWTRLSKATNCCRSLAAKEHRQHGEIKFGFGLLGCDILKAGAIPFSGVPTGGISVAVNRSDLVEPENFGSDGWNLGSHGYELACVLAVLLAAGTPSLPKCWSRDPRRASDLPHMARLLARAKNPAELVCVPNLQFICALL